MAITVVSEPADISSIYRPVEYKVTSDAGTIVRMKGSVVVSGVFVNEDTPIILDPDLGTTDNFTFDIQSIVQDFVPVDEYLPLTSALGDYDNANNASASVKMRFTEVLLTGGVLVDGASFLIAQTKFVINTILKHTESDLTKFRLADSTKKFLTRSPSSKFIGASDDESLSAIGIDLPSAVNPTDNKVEIKTFDSTGTLIATFKTNGVVSQTKFRYDIPIGTNNLNNWTLTTGSQPIITSSVAFYEILIKDESDVVASEKKTYVIDRNCFVNSTRFHFVNGLGGLDSFTFKGRHTEGLQVTSQDFQKILASNFVVSDRGRTELQINADEKFEVWSDLLTFDTITWLKDIYLSPQVFIQEGTDFIPILILNKDKWFKDSEILKVPQLRLQYVKANPVETQRS